MASVVSVYRDACSPDIIGHVDLDGCERLIEQDLMPTGLPALSRVIAGDDHRQYLYRNAAGGWLVYVYRAKNMNPLFSGSPTWEHRAYFIAPKDAARWYDERPHLTPPEDIAPFVRGNRDLTTAPPPEPPEAPEMATIVAKPATEAPPAPEGIADAAGGPEPAATPRDQGKADRCRGLYMAAIQEGRTPPSATELAATVGCSKATASRAIKPLEDKRKGYARQDAAARYRDHDNDEDVA